MAENNERQFVFVDLPFFWEREGNWSITGIYIHTVPAKRTLHLVFLFQRQRFAGSKCPQLFIKHPAMILLSSMASIAVRSNEIYMSRRDNDRNPSVFHAQEHVLDDMGPG